MEKINVSPPKKTHQKSIDCKKNLIAWQFPSNVPVQYTSYNIKLYIKNTYEKHNKRHTNSPIFYIRIVHGCKKLFRLLTFLTFCII